MKQNKIRYILNLMLFIVISFFNTQLIPLLNKVGYSVGQRNLILAVNALFAVVLQILSGVLSDRYKTMKKIFTLSYIIFLLFGIWMFIETKKRLFLHIIITSMMSALAKVLSGLIETWMLYLSQKDYGKYRSFGAIGLCIGSPLAGFIIDKVSYFGVILCALLVSVIVFLCTFYTDEMEFKENIDYKKMIHCIKQKEYLYMMLIYVCIYIVGSADQYIVIDKMLHLKANSFLIGIKWAIQSLMEIPFFLFANKILKKWNVYNVLKIGIIMYGIKFLLYGMASSSILIVLVSVLQIVTLPVVAYTSKIIFSDICPSLKSSTQMIAMAFFLGGSAFITPIISSFLLPIFDYNVTLYIFALFTLIPLGMLIYKKHVL